MILQHRIELEEGAVPKQAAVYAEADEELRQGVIEESESALNNTTWSMRIGNSGWRKGVDRTKHL